ncbi:MAG: CoA ester lyase [Rhodobacterales bacterium]|nr:CoA ester lyase [Rhodobacterales bacterium]
MALPRPRRSVLYMPGSNARALEKAKTLPVDALILDLEDAVAPEVKAEAREQVAAAVKTRSYGHREVVMRINGLDTPWGADDLKAAAAAAPDAVLIPKVSTADDIAQVAEVLNRSGTPETTTTWAMMESPLAVLDPLGVTKAARDPSNRLSCLVMGTNDLAKETRMRIIPGRANMMGWLADCVIAARAMGVDILDGVYNDFRNDDGLKEECDQGRDLGMNGKTLIHPGQVAICNAAFSPSEAEVADARAIIEAFDLPENRDKAAINLNGRMVERLHAEIAQRVVDLADAIAAQG